MTAAPIRLIDLGVAPFWLTQAAYHAVAGRMRAATPDTIILARPRTPYLCLGYHDVYDDALDRAAVARRGLPVLRRRVGGGTTYLDGDQIFYQCIFHHARVPALFAAVYQRMLAAPLAVLRGLGLDARLRDTVELEAGGRRVAGIGGGRIGEAAVVVGNLLGDFDYDAMADVWRAPWPAYRALAAAALRDHVTTLRELLGAPPPMEELSARLAAAFAESLGRPLQRGALSPGEARYARRLGARMAAPETLALHDDPARRQSPRPLKIAGGVYIHAAEATIGGRRVRAGLRVQGGRIAAARLESDPPGNWAGVESALRGLPPDGWEARVAATLEAARVP